MIKRELKVNLKSFIIWTSIIIGIFLIVFMVYPSIIENNDTKSIGELMKLFPEEILKAFNMDIADISSSFGWLKSEGMVFILLLTGTFSALLGANILLKEESDKTIEYLTTLPISRKKIVFSRIITGLFYIVLMIGIVAIFNFIGLSLSGAYDKKLYWLLSISPLAPSIVIFSLSMFISTFMHKSKKMIGISMGIVFLGYIFQVMSMMSDKIAFLKYFSPMTLADTRNIINDGIINPLMIILSLVITIIFFILTIIHYEKKELV